MDTKYEWPFAMLHRQQAGEQVKVVITLAVDPALEGLAAAFYMDGSASMEESGDYGDRMSGLARLLGRPPKRNPVSDAMRVIVPYIANKDATRSVLTAYWSCGDVQRNGSHPDRWRDTVQVIGQLDAAQAAEMEYRGPTDFGNATFLLPAVRHFVEYVKGLTANGEVVKAALAVIVTDGKFHDLPDVLRYSTESLGPAIIAGKFCRTNISIVGVGPDIDQHQMEALMSQGSPSDFPGFGIWSYALAESLDDLSGIVSHLVDKNVPAFWGGATVVDEKGNVLGAFEDMVPAIIELTVPTGTESFTLQVGDKSFTKKIADIPIGHMAGMGGTGMAASGHVSPGGASHGGEQDSGGAHGMAM